MAAVKHIMYTTAFDPECYELAEAIVTLNASRKQKRRLDRAIKELLTREKQRSYGEGFAEGVKVMLDLKDRGADYGS